MISFSNFLLICNQLEKQLVAVVMDLFSAGTETVSNTIGNPIISF